MSCVPYKASVVAPATIDFSRTSFYHDKRHTDARTHTHTHLNKHTQTHKVKEHQPAVTAGNKSEDNFISWNHKVRAGEGDKVIDIAYLQSMFYIT